VGAFDAGIVDESLEMCCPGPVGVWAVVLSVVDELVAAVTPGSLCNALAGTFDGGGTADESIETTCIGLVCD
jgi:hypothetical protein